MSEPKYHDGKYHTEFVKHQYFNGYEQADWTIVNIYGEHCRVDGRTLRFANYVDAKRYCDKLNVTPEGACITNLT